MIIKRAKNHTFYEVWNEWAAESVFFDHKPTKKELVELLEHEQWDDQWLVRYSTKGKDAFMKEMLHVEKFKKLYTKV